VPSRFGDVELSEDMRHERREWIVQRAGWVAMALLVAAAVAGLFGSGPLARAQTEAAGLKVDYPRFARDGADSELDVRLEGTRLWIGREVGDHFTVESVTPSPERVRLLPDRWVYEYPGGPPSRLMLKLRPNRAGRGALRLGVEGAGEVRVAPLVFP
jgi:hypothetical protein